MWLLVLALPLQGCAAATMAACGAAHHGAVRVAHGGHEHASHAHAADAIDASASIDHAAAAHAVAPHDGSTAGSHATEHAQGLGKCSACAACCTVAFLPTAVIAFNTPQAGAVLATVEPAARVGFFTDGPERPPRSFLA